MKRLLAIALVAFILPTGLLTYAVGRLWNRLACPYVSALGRAKHRRLHQRTRCGDFVTPCKGIA